MPVDTAKVEGRRQLKFSTLDDILAELERLNQSKLRTLGNWSPGQILRHLSVPMDWCLDGAKVQAPWYVRLFGWFMKNRFLRNPMPAGFALPEATAKYLVPEETSWEEGLRILRTSIQRLKTESQRHRSPFLGELTREQWDQLHCRHAELHLSFLIPEAV
ncbi:MAG: DUF1569 domain-containing protein [Gemmataceae bacterium]|nr:DUF1569 domain-containing protein [Gemmataceae bacterium]